MSEKKYRIRKEIKHLFDENVGNWNLTKDEWSERIISEEALEEVEERIDIRLELTTDDYNLIKVFNNGAELQWTEQEREDIEKFLNVFGSWDKMVDLVHSWEHSKSDLIVHTFESWLKEKGYDK